ncbi:nacht and wd40 domain protein [Ophiostoma piceae UAMH 11346]|uniref:Nacht and wd40 domain protein n=1 Tax=Ophiostoma piceae (strain UAMH 11346) TaxID=1262450 RepID=S3BSN4_OPHP1|nr:nacht and wd40 domain protein [Ophiostoma piceae UAMH 11346]
MPPKKDSKFRKWFKRKTKQSQDQSQSHAQTPGRLQQESSSNVITPSPGSQCSPPESVAQVQRPTVDEPGSDADPIAQGITQTVPVLNSQEVWNEAFNRIEEDQETAELFQAYMKVLNDTLGSSSDGGDDDTVGDMEAESRSAATRQKQMARLVKEGQEKIQRTSKITKAVGDFVEAVLVLKPAGDFVIKNIPQASPAALPWASILSNPASASKANLEGVKNITARMEWYCALTDILLDTGSIESGRAFSQAVGSLRERIVCLYHELLLFLMKSVCSYYKNQGLVYLKSMFVPNDWKESLDKIEQVESLLRTSFDQYSGLHQRKALQECSDRAEESVKRLGNINETIQNYVDEQSRMRRSEADRSLLRKLCVVDPRDVMGTIEKRKDDLLEDAFRWILDVREFQAFTDHAHVDSHSDASALQSPASCRLLWIKGPPGTGKTMLLIGIIRELSSRSYVLNPSISYFFFEATNMSLNNSTAALRSLLWMLFLQQPHLFSHMQEKYENTPPVFDGDHAFVSLSNVLWDILADPDLGPAYFIIDAMDECAQDLPQLIDLIATSLTLSDKIKWLVSSRPTVPLDGSVAARSLVELDSQKLKDPVSAYIRHQLSRLTSRNGFTGYTKEIIADISSEINKRAQNTFLWVWLVFQRLTTKNKHGKLLYGSYAPKIIKEFPPGLSSLYDKIMDTIDEGDEDDPEYCKATLRAIFLAYRPLSLGELGTLVPFPPEQVARIVGECGSLLSVSNDTVNLVHLSAKDYLRDNYSSRLSTASTAQGHAKMSEHCLGALDGLHKNMYGISLGPYQKDAAVPQPDPLASLRYACLFWADHLHDAADQGRAHGESLSNTKLVDDFLRKHFLHWLESLSLLNQFSSGIASMRTLSALFPISEAASRLADFVYDALRFILSYRFCIDEAPLQAYASALLFSPTNSKVRRCFETEQLEWVKTKPIVPAEWDSCLQTLNGHTSYVYSVVYSPDGKQLASASWDNTVKIWNAASGECEQTLRGHTNWVLSVIFSLDGKQLTSASSDDTVKVWNAASGECEQTLKGHIESVKSVIYSLNGKQLASASIDMTIKVWNAASGECEQTLKGHTNPVMSVVFSPDGKQLASASTDNTVKVWDVISKKSIQTLESHNAVVWFIAFSLDGKQLASGSLKTVKIWDAVSGECLHTLNGHTDWANVVAFSPDGKQLASGSKDETVKIWDAVSGECLHTLKGHTKSVGVVAYSPDGKQLASGSKDETVKIWDAVSGECLHTLNGHTDWANVVAFSPDGKQLASGSKDETVKIWDAVSGECLHTLKGHTKSVGVVAYSPDGKQLASGSKDETVKIWDAVSGECLHTLKGHTKSVGVVAYSPDGKQLASGSDDKTVKIWDAVSGECLHTLKGHTKSVDAIAFSPDGKQLASLSDDRTVKIWDTASGKCTHTQEDYGASDLSNFFSDETQRSNGSSQVYGLNEEESWITKDGQELLWLPNDYRPSEFGTKYATHGQRIGFGLASGRVVFVGF